MVYFGAPATANNRLQERTDLASFGPAPPRSQAESLTELFELHYDRIARYIAARVGNRDLAEDMASDVFVRAVESYASYQQRGLPIQAWLFRIAHNIVIDYYRRASKRHSAPIEEVGDIAGGTDVFDEVELRLSMERVGEAMQSLNAGQQEVISLRLIGGLSAEEAGIIMERTPGAIRELQRTALKALRGLLGSEITHLGAVMPPQTLSGNEEGAE